MNEASIETHCGRAGCSCTHDGGCFKGWIDKDEGVTRPCVICRESLSLALGEIARPGKRSDGDLAKLRSHAKTAQWQETA